ncbi:MAG: hypothetical protein EA365_10760 [Gloeocapsa sp. DLM2.Bin57]|nr:MAG: hypothetical protein EA365_10760 [Gloeocapsa sp. DLM2.Bin57]
MLKSPTITNKLVGKYNQLISQLKKGKDKVRNFLKNLVKFNYPKPKRVIYENIAYLVKFPTYLARKYLAQQLKNKQLIDKIEPQKGYLVINNLEFPPLQKAQEYAQERLKSTKLQDLIEKAAGKHQYLLALPIKQELTLDSPLLQLALNPDLLKIVTEYIGILPILNSVNILYSPNQTIFEHSSQYFHLDPEGVRQVKIFIYLDEVTEDSGPFTLISAEQSQKVYPVYRGGRLTDEFVSQLVPPTEFTPITGPKGTMILVDTSSCFHFGSRPGTEDRPAILLQYISPFAMIFPYFGWKRKTRLSHLVQKDTPILERYLLGASWF